MWFTRLSSEKWIELEEQWRGAEKCIELEEQWSELGSGTVAKGLPGLAAASY